MDIRSLRYFIDVAQMGSFADVARKHDVDPSTVSRMIAALEAEIGVRLLQRTTRSHSLTEAGDQYLLRIEPLIEELELAAVQASAAKEEPQGLLRITASVAFGQECIVPLLKDFSIKYPKIEIELLLSDDNINLVENKIDLAVRLGPTMDNDLIVSKLMDTKYRVVASEVYVANNPRLLSPRDLNEHSCVLFTYPAFRSSWTFRNSGKEIEEVLVNGKFYFSNALALREAVRQGMGPGLLANWLTDEDIKQNKLVDIFPEYDVTATSFDTGAWLLYPSRSYLSKKVRVMIDFLKSRSDSLVN